MRLRRVQRRSHVGAVPGILMAPSYSGGVSLSQEDTVVELVLLGKIRYAFGDVVHQKDVGNR